MQAFTFFHAAASKTFSVAALALFRRQDATFDNAPGGGSASFFLMLLQTLLALGLVCGLAYVIFRWILPRLSVVRRGGRMVNVADRVTLDARRSLYVIEVAGRWLLIASSEAGVQLVSELDAKNAEEAAAESERLRPTFGADAAAMRGAFAERLAQVMNRKGGK